MGILDMYKKQFEEDKKNENYDLPENCVAVEGFDEEEYRNELRNMREKMDSFHQNKTLTEDIDIEYEEPQQIKSDEEMLNAFKNEFEYHAEKDMKVSNTVVQTVLRRAYCPKCGAEIISDFPSSFNPFTHEKICRHECKSCGYRMNLEYTYPRVVYVDENGVETNAYGL